MKFELIDDGTFAEIIAYYGRDIVNVSFSLNGYSRIPMLTIYLKSQHYWELNYTKLDTWRLQDFESIVNNGEVITTDDVVRVGKIIDMIHKIDAVI